MTFSLLEIELHCHSQSWIAILAFNYHCLFEVEWTHDMKLDRLEVMFFRIV